MFKYSEKTQVNIPFKMLELFKTIKANKDVKSDASVVAGVKLTNILSPDRTFLEANNEVKEIYVIELALTTKTVPMLFVDCFNKYIDFQTLFKLIYKNECKYISSIKDFTEDKTKVLKYYESNWEQEKIKQEFPITTKLDFVFKEMIKYITTISFKQNETFGEYISRMDQIKKLKTEIEKQTKTMNNEKQPNLRMALNDKIKDLKRELAESLN